ncbi:MAG: inositol 2-dehydrogenase [Chloroflexi bacterium]|nr:inositol 2-dehydrogenase [Chloroflexota bacterium]
MASRIRVGVIGTGRIGQLHARHLARNITQASLVAVSDVAISAAERCAADLDVPYVTDDYRDILSDPDVEAVVICSSTDTHTQIIKDAARAGRHVFCEKPIDVDLARIDSALDAVDRAGIKFQVGFNRRFDPSFRRLRAGVLAGDIGEPHILRITSRDPAPPPIEYIRVSGGIFLDMTTHDFDMARFLIGSEVEEIYTSGAVRVDPAIGQAGDLDTAVITLRFANGVLGTIDNSRQAVYGYDQRVEVFGSAGMIQADNSFANTVVLSDARNVARDLPLNFFMDRYIESYVAEMTAFVDCILNDQQPEVTGVDGRIPVIMGYAARRSYEQRRPVRLDEIASA